MGDRVYVCGDCDPPTEWPNMHDFAVHWEGTHSAPEPCSHCGVPVRGRGRARHEARCQVEMATKRLVTVSAGVRSRVIDFFRRANDPPRGPHDVIMVPHEGPPIVIRQPELARQVGEGAYMFSARLVDVDAVLEAERQRDRRVGRPADLSPRPKPRNEAVLPQFKEREAS